MLVALADGQTAEIIAQPRWGARCVPGDPSICGLFQRGGSAGFVVLPIVRQYQHAAVVGFPRTPPGHERHYVKHYRLGEMGRK